MFVDDGFGVGMVAVSRSLLKGRPYEMFSVQNILSAKQGGVWGNWSLGNLLCLKAGGLCTAGGRRAPVSVCSGRRNKAPQTRGLKQQERMPHGSGGWTPEIKVLPGFISPEASVLGLQRPPLPVSSQRRPSVPICVLIFFLQGHPSC